MEVVEDGVMDSKNNNVLKIGKSMGLSRGWKRVL
jgi:hypothetical protein